MQYRYNTTWEKLIFDAFVILIDPDKLLLVKI